MPLPVKISDALFNMAKAEASATNRSATAQIEHWATLGRAVEALLAYGDMLALKRIGTVIPLPREVPREEIQGLLLAVAERPGREEVKAHIHASGGPVYTADPRYPGRLVEVRPDGTRVPGRLQDRRFIPDGSGSPKRPE